MTDKILEERIQKLEAQVAAFIRANAGLTVGAGLNRLGQRTLIDGDLDMHEHKVVNGKIDPVDNLTSIGQAAGRYPAADGTGGVIWQDAIQPAVYFLHSEAADLANFRTLDDAPTDDPVTFDMVDITNASGWVTLREFVTAPGGLGTTLLAAGVYEFHFWARVASTAGNTLLKADLYKRSGIVNTLFATAIAPDFTSTAVTERVFSVAVGDQILLPTDRLILVVSISTDSAANINVKFYYEGTTEYSHFHTPGMAGSPADHGGLIGLGDDDHPQYLPVDGSRSITNDLRIGSGLIVGDANPVINPGTGEIWMGKQIALPVGGSNFGKLINYKNTPYYIDENGGQQPLLMTDNWTHIAENILFSPAQTNQCLNASFETNNLNWGVNGGGSSLTRVATGVNTAAGVWCGRAVMAGAGVTHMIYCATTSVIGQPYRIGFYARSVSGNTALHSELFGGDGTANVTLTAAWQWFSYMAYAYQTGTNCHFWLAAAGTFEIDGVSLVVLPNSILNGEFETDVANWTPYGPGTTFTRQAGGFSGAWSGRVVQAAGYPAHGIYTMPALIAGKTYRFSVWAKSIAGSTTMRMVINGGETYNIPVVLTAAFLRYTFDFVATGTTALYLTTINAGTYDIDSVSIIDLALDPPYSDPSWAQANGQAWTGTTFASATTRIGIYYLSGYWLSGANYFEPGVKLLVNDGAWKYFYSVSIWYDAIRNLTVFVPFAGTSYLPTANPIYLFVSRAAHPKSFPHWFSYTATVTTLVGTITTYTATCRFCLIGKTVFFENIITITNNGTGASALYVSIPLLCNTYFNGSGREGGVTGKTLQVVNSGTGAAVFNYDNTYPGGNNYLLIFNAFYEML